jgi:hypothetical protein
LEIEFFPLKELKIPTEFLFSVSTIHISIRQDSSKYFQRLREDSSLSYPKAPWMEFQKYGDSFWNFFLWNSKDFDLEFFLGFLNSSLSGDELTEEWIQLPFSHLPKFDPFFQELELNFPARTELTVDSKAFH